MPSKNSRQGSHNHLLGFSYDAGPSPHGRTRELYGANDTPPRVSPAAGPARPPGVAAVPVADAQQAKRAFFLESFRYVLYAGSVTSDPAVAAAVTSPDVMPPWAAVKYVVHHAPFDDFSCPVCLEPPVAPRVLTLCGHVLCHKCLLRHASYAPTPEGSRHPRITCPLCSGPVPRLDSRPLLHVPVLAPEAGPASPPMEFRLVWRRQGCPVTTPLPTDSATKLQPFCEGRSNYSRYQLPGAGTVEAVRQQQLALQSQLGTAEGPEDDVALEERFLTEALVALSDLTDGDPTEDPLDREDIFEAAQGAVLCGPVGSGSGVGPTSAFLAAASTQPVVAGFEAADGQPLYLHPLSFAILKDSFGGAEHMPDTLALTVLDVEPAVQTAKTRQKWRATAHVPLFAAFRLAFVDVHHIAPPHVLAKYKESLDARRRRHEAERARADRHSDAAARRTAEKQQRQLSVLGGVAMTCAPQYYADPAAAAAALATEFVSLQGEPEEDWSHTESSAGSAGVSPLHRPATPNSAPRTVSAWSGGGAAERLRGVSDRPGALDLPRSASDPWGRALTDVGEASPPAEGPAEVDVPPPKKEAGPKRKGKGKKGTAIEGSFF